MSLVLIKSHYNYLRESGKGEVKSIEIHLMFSCVESAEFFLDFYTFLYFNLWLITLSLSSRFFFKGALSLLLMTL